MSLTSTSRRPCSALDPLDEGTRPASGSRWSTRSAEPAPPAAVIRSPVSSIVSGRSISERAGDPTAAAGRVHVRHRRGRARRRIARPAPEWRPPPARRDRPGGGRDRSTASPVLPPGPVDRGWSLRLYPADGPAGPPSAPGRHPVKGPSSVTSAAGTAGGRPAACRRSGRWGSTAGWSRRTTPRAPCRRRPGRAGRCGRARRGATSSRPSARWRPARGSGRRRRRGRRGWRRTASAARSSSRLLAGLNGDIRAACRSSSE